MKLLFTGASGFLGSNLKPLLKNNFEIKTLGLTDDDDYKVNIAITVPEIDILFDVVLHAAGKAHSIPKTEEEKKSFFDINFQGTANLCRALEKSGLPKAFIFVSTVAVYGLEAGENITEEYPLNGDSPYALSKIKAEEFLTDWCVRNNVTLGIIRPSLIAGPNPLGNLGAMIDGIKSGAYLSIAGGKARKSILMVQDIARLLPALIEKGGIYNICDDSQPTFRELELLIAKQLGKRSPISISYSFAKFLASAGDFLGKNAPINSLKLSKITESLTFSNEKAKQELNWQPLNVLENFMIK
ncbi:MAG: N-acetyl-alpha-D-glucosaminyl-diphospho-ditrans,octacis-undecaprenol 4-epimerase [Petrimonas sp.]|uniref:NAD-dependent epimerase/dehydratase family protein n=1 Tax=Petrimonas sp. TaxID=2023866 RepID=UPI0030CDAC35